MMTTMLMCMTLAASSVEFEGSLKDALKHIAQAGELNLVVAGELDEKVEVQLADLPPGEALDALAKVYGLDVQKQGKLWVVRKAVADSQSTPPVTEKVVATVEEKVVKEQVPIKQRSIGLSKADGDVVSTGEVRVRSGEHVKTAVSYGGPVVVERGGSVDDDAVAVGGDVIVEAEGHVGGDAVAMGGRVVVNEGGHVGGQRVAMGAAGLGSLLGGVGAFTPPSSRIERYEREESNDGFSLAGFLLRLGTLFGLGFLLTVMAPQRIKTMESMVMQEPLKSGLAGFLGTLALLPLSALLIITLVGAPLALALWLVVSVGVVMGLVAMAMAIGSALPSGKLRRTQALVLGMGCLVLSVAAEIPYLGPAMVVLAGLVSLGVVIRTRMGAPRLGMPIPQPSMQ